MRHALLLLAAAAALSLAGVSSTSCSSSNGGGAGGGSAGGSTAGGSGGSAGGTVSELADADAGICDAGTIATACATFDDRTAADAGRTIEFGTTDPGAQVPLCMQIKRGQTVTIHSGSFHPAVQDCGPVNRKVNTPESATTPVTFGVAGDYAYHCSFHFFPGYIRVVP